MTGFFTAKIEQLEQILQTKVTAFEEMLQQEFTLTAGCTMSLCCCQC